MYHNSRSWTLVVCQVWPGASLPLIRDPRSNRRGFLVLMGIMRWGLGSVYLLFLDEFGDFSDPRSTIKSESTRPMCGYAGFLIPAANYRTFCDHFVELRIIAMNAGAYAKYTATHREGDRLTFDEFMKLITSPTNRINVMQDEIKGSEVFSTSFFAKKTTGIERKKRNILRYARMFLRLLDNHEATLVYCGIIRDPYFARLKGRSLARPLHVELVRNALDVAYQIAQEKRSQIKMIFDHHQKDDETKERITAKQNRVHVYSIAKLQTRQEYSREVLMEKGYYPYIKEPIFNIRSHWSLGVQAADWICSLMGKLKAYEITPQDFRKFETYYTRLSEAVNYLVEDRSNLKHFDPKKARQLRFPFDPPGPAVDPPPTS